MRDKLDIFYMPTATKPNPGNRQTKYFARFASIQIHFYSQSEKIDFVINSCIKLYKVIYF